MTVTNIKSAPRNRSYETNPLKMAYPFDYLQVSRVVPTQDEMEMVLEIEWQLARLLDDHRDSRHTDRFACDVKITLHQAQEYVQGYRYLKAQIEDPNQETPECFDLDAPWSGYVDAQIEHFRRRIEHTGYKSLIAKLRKAKQYVITYNR